MPETDSHGASNNSLPGPGPLAAVARAVPVSDSESGSLPVAGSESDSEPESARAGESEPESAGAGVDNLNCATRAGTGSDSESDSLPSSS